MFLRDGRDAYRVPPCPMILRGREGIGKIGMGGVLRPEGFMARLLGLPFWAHLG